MLKLHRPPEGTHKRRGLGECVLCGDGPTTVKDSRPHGCEIRRRRRCLACGGRYTTWERPVLDVIDDVAHRSSMHERETVELFGLIVKLPNEARVALLRLAKALWHETELSRAVTSLRIPYLTSANKVGFRDLPPPDQES